MNKRGSGMGLLKVMAHPGAADVDDHIFHGRAPHGDGPGKIGRDGRATQGDSRAEHDGMGRRLVLQLVSRPRGDIGGGHDVGADGQVRAVLFHGADGDQDQGALAVQTVQLRSGDFIQPEYQ